MKRGDPFLPSIFPDENPIADYTAKKNSHKKPFDCKCKGFGYNVSPSALLPEEMRQQWGVGMLCKPSLSRASIISTINNCNTLDNEAKCTPANVTINSSGCTSNNCCVISCKNYTSEHCPCNDINTKNDSFRIPDSSTIRKPKLLTKGSSIKCKENKNPGSLLIGSTNRSLLLKRTACCNNKDKNNIISTSNFQRKNTSFRSVNGHSSAISGLNDCNCGMFGSQINCGSTYQSMVCNMRKHRIASQEDILPTPQQQYHQQQSQQFVANITSSPILPCPSLSVPDCTFEAKGIMPRSTAQMLMLADEDCVCDNCQQRLSLMTRIEKLGFSTSNVQQILPPFMLASSQKYQLSTFQPSSSAHGRYTPYNVPIYGYPHSSDDVYHSPEGYQCSAPSYFEYIDHSSLHCQPIACTPLSVAHEVNKMDTSYLDIDHSMTSTHFGSFVEDITDLSVKDTVDFFVTMKSPFLNSFPSSSASDKCSGVYQSLFTGEQCISASFNSGPNSCLCPLDICASSYPMTSMHQESIYGEFAHIKFEDFDLPSQSIMYSSLMSDLEDELCCAKENILAG